MKAERGVTKRGAAKKDKAAAGGVWQKLRKRRDEAEASGDLDTVHYAGQRMTTKLVHVGLAAAVLCGPVGLFVAASTAGRPVPVRTSSAAPIETLTAQDATRVGEFAQRVVRGWLSATRAKPGELNDLFGEVSGLKLPERPTRVDHAEAAEIRPTSVTGIFQVTIAATVEGTARYYTVPVQVGDDKALVALALPAPAGGPAATRASQGPYRADFDRSGPTAATVLAFLRSLLTGQGDITRYISPEASIEAIDPAPYVQVDLTEVVGLADEADPAEGAQAHVLVTVAGTDAAKRTTTTQYALTLKARGGRWEVAAIDLAPAITRSRKSSPGTPATPDPTVSPTTTPGTPSTSTTQR